jgi:hypothetical protein
MDFSIPLLWREAVLRKNLFIPQKKTTKQFTFWHPSPLARVCVEENLFISPKKTPNQFTF